MNQRFSTPLSVFVAAVIVVLFATSGRDVIATVQNDGVIAGVAKIDGKPVSNAVVRVRNVDSGQLVGNSAASTSGEFSFTGLAPGNYIVEMVSTNGTIVGTSVAIPLTPGLMVSTNITVSASAAAVAAAGGAGAAGSTAIGAAATGSSGLSASVLAVAAVGATLGTTAIVAVENDASPSR